MTRLMEEATTRHIKAVHYSASASICIGENPTKPNSKPGFLPVILETLFGGRLQKGEAECADQRVREVTGWSDPVKESTYFVEVTCKN